MKSKTSNSTTGNQIDCFCKSLNNTEMLSLRGGTGTIPPIPSSGGDDFPIDILSPKAMVTSFSTLTYTTTTVTTDTDVDLKHKHKK